MARHELSRDVWLLLDREFQWTTRARELYRSVEPAAVDWVLEQVHRARREPPPAVRHLQERKLFSSLPESQQLTLRELGARFKAWYPAFVSGLVAALALWISSDPVRKIQFLAHCGSVEAASELGDLYSSGREAPKELKRALRWYRMAAGQGDAYAQRRVGQGYERGWLGKADKAEAAKWYRRAAGRGDIESQWLLGSLLLREGSPEASRWISRAAAEGHGTAQYRLGSLYENGWDVPQDFEAAARWYQSAAKSVPQAASSLGRLYETGNGVHPSSTKALHWYRHAAARGDLFTQLELAGRYRSGQGIEQDPVEAFVWISLAAEHGLMRIFKKTKRSVSRTRDELRTLLSPQQLREASRRIEALKQRQQ